MRGKFGRFSHLVKKSKVKGMVEGYFQSTFRKYIKPELRDKNNMSPCNDKDHCINQKYIVILMRCDVNAT